MKGGRLRVDPDGVLLSVEFTEKQLVVELNGKRFVLYSEE